MDATQPVRTPGSVRLLTFNIRQGGRSRLDAISDTILRHDPDIAVLTEYRASTAKVLPAQVAARGLTHQTATEVQGSENGICIVSRLPFRLVTDSRNPCPSPRHYLEAQFQGFRLGAIYRPMRNVDFDAYAEWFVNLLWKRRRTSFVITGDFNILEPSDKARTEGAGFISDLGFVDAWRLLHDGETDYSWTNHNGTRTRIDYAFLSPRVAPRLTAAWHPHDEGELAVSDHCPLIVDLRAPALISRIRGLVGWRTWRTETG